MFGRIIHKPSLQLSLYNCHLLHVSALITAIIMCHNLKMPCGSLFKYKHDDEKKVRYHFFTYSIELKMPNLQNVVK
jgi:hypothetical protein